MKSTVFAAALLAGGLALPLGAQAHPEVRYGHSYHVGPFGAVHYVGRGHRCGYEHYYGHRMKHHRWAHKHHRKHHGYAEHGRHDRHYAYDGYRDRDRDRRHRGY